MAFLSEYLTLVHEAQTPEPSNESTGKWHPFSIGTARAALLADKSQLQHVALGFDLLGTHAAGTKLRAGNHLLFKIRRGPHQEKACNCIMQCVASLELARRREKESKGLLQPSAAHEVSGMCTNWQAS
eukprot:205424-Pelagomonas_calceolata.AAC.6